MPRIYVGNLPADVREDELDDLFHKFGRIRRIDVKVFFFFYVFFYSKQSIFFSFFKFSFIYIDQSFFIDHWIWM